MTTATLHQLTAIYFDQTYYLQNNPDVLQAIADGMFSSALDHFEQFGQFEGRAPIHSFDAAQYLINNPDVLAAVNAGILPSAWAHFVAYGIAEDRNDGTFSGSFNDAAYLAANADVAAAVISGDFINGYDHFLRFGITEGRFATNLLGTPISIVTGSTFTLTNGMDSGAAFIATPANDAFIAGESIGLDNARVPTWTAGDALDGGGGADTFTVIQTGSISLPLAATVLNIRTANITSGDAIALDTTGWTGLLALHTVSSRVTTLTAAPTTDVTTSIRDLSGSPALVINGGQNVDVTAASGVANAAITIGASLGPAAAIHVLDTYTGTNNTHQGDIRVTGGTTVNVTERAANAVFTTVSLGTVSVTGGAATTAVTVVETAAATAGPLPASSTGRSMCPTSTRPAQPWPGPSPRWTSPTTPRCRSATTR